MRVIVTDELSKEGLAILTEGSKVVVDVKPGISPEDLLKVIGEYDAIIIRSGTKVNKQVIEAGKKLKVIGRAGRDGDSPRDLGNEHPHWQYRIGCRARYGNDAGIGQKDRLGRCFSEIRKMGERKILRH
jgi:hypothetical protein